MAKAAPAIVLGAALLMAGGAGAGPAPALAQDPAAAPAVAQGPAAEIRPHAALWERLVAAEDARARTPEQRAVLLEGTRSPAPVIRRIAVGGLGRLERAEEVPSIAPLLEDGDAGVRAAAIRALGRAVVHGDPGAARPLLIEALAAERDPAASAATAETLGRLRHEAEPEARATLDLLLPHLAGSPEAALGAARGLYFLARQPSARAAFHPAAVEALERLATSHAATRGAPGAAAAAAAATAAPSAAETAARTRTVAVMALVVAGRAAAPLLAAALEDREPAVRREAAAGIAVLADTAVALRLAMRAVADASHRVRHEALRSYGRRLAASHGCAPVRRAARDPDVHVALLALDLLGGACVADPDPRDAALLDSLARALPPAEHGAWHRAAHALTSLAALWPDRAAERLPPFVAHPSPFVRSYAAGAAAAAGDAATLRRLAVDPHPNVRTAAVEGLRATAGRGADEVYIAQLEHEDSQLLQAAAAALEDSPDPAAAGALLDALDRVTLRRRETERDARAALLARAGQLGGPDMAARLRPYLRDYDPRIAALAADVIRAWSGERPEPAPEPLPAPATPEFGEAAALAAARVVIELHGGDTIELRLLPFDAPTNAARFARLARQGYYDGLTLHRVVANFVVQGGSPAANEYAGDGPYTRDEIGHSNWRGTVGLSTRGRDTGDAQLYINLADNVRLDTDYTVFARVTRGMDAVDRLQEGAVMRRVVID